MLFADWGQQYQHFLCPMRSQHSLDRFEMVRWGSVPRGFCFRTFVAPFPPTGLTAFGSPRMGWGRKTVRPVSQHFHLALWDVEEPTPLFGASQFHIFYWFKTMNWIPPSSIVALSTSDITFLARSDKRWPEEPVWRAFKGMFFVWGK